MNPKPTQYVIQFPNGTYYFDYPDMQHAWCFSELSATKFDTMTEANMRGFELGYTKFNVIPVVFATPVSQS